MPFGLHKILPQPATYITVMRGAVERVISAYYFMSNYMLHPNYWKFRREGWTLEDFVRRSPRENVQTKMIAGAVYEEPCTAEIFAKAKDNLQYFSVVGLTERFEERGCLLVKLLKCILREIFGPLPSMQSLDTGTSACSPCPSEFSTSCFSLPPRNS